MDLKEEILKSYESQEDFARQAGINKSLISQWILGKHKPSDLMLERLSKYLKIDQETLFDHFKRIGKSKKFKEVEIEDDKMIASNFLNLLSKAK